MVPNFILTLCVRHYNFLSIFLIDLNVLFIVMYYICYYAMYLYICVIIRIYFVIKQDRKGPALTAHQVQCYALTNKSHSLFTEISDNR